MTHGQDQIMDQTDPEASEQLSPAELQEFIRLEKELEQVIYIYMCVCVCV